MSGKGTNSMDIEAQEHVLEAMVEHRTREVRSIRNYLIRYNTQLEKAEKELKDYEFELASLRAQKNADQTANAVRTEIGAAEITDVVQIDAAETNNNAVGDATDAATFSGEGFQQLILAPLAEDHDQSLVPAHLAEDEEHNQSSLIPLIGKNSSAGSPNYQKSNFISSLHKRRVRTLTLCPVNDKFFATSSLDGWVRLWEVQSGGFDASLLTVTDECLSPTKRRWPEDIAWHSNGNSLFSAHSADGQDSQVSIMHLTGGNGEMREIFVDFLEAKPHVKGVINSIAFLPQEDPAFVTAGTDHAVAIWRENGGENKWTAETLHRNHHTAAVMGVSGMQHKQIVLSAGKDRRILGYDVASVTKDFTHQVDGKCLGVLANPIDFNLFVVQTGTPKKQLRLFDIRMKEKEIQDFGWKQRSSETQSALIKPSWSSNGLFMTCGSDDPLIHIFDIRYKGHNPSLSIEGHKKRVFKAAWLRSLPLLISISSDLDLGLHVFA